LYRDTEIRRALAAGARSYALKSMLPKDLTETIRQVHAGKKPIPPEVATRIAEHLGDDPLTNREVEVLELATGGTRNRDIAKRLLISEETVKAHVMHILEKLGANDRTQAVTIAAQRGELSRSKGRRLLCLSKAGARNYIQENRSAGEASDTASNVFI
jgi:DNA-binding NarL/FixJ family response regulator